MRTPMLFVFLFAACTGGLATDPVPDRNSDADKADLQQHMRDHQAKAVAARDGLVHGGVQGSRVHFEWLAKHLEPPSIAEGKTLDDMQAGATRGVNAAEAAVAANGLAEMGVACGRCHKAEGAGPKFTPAQLPSLDEGARTHMARHEWALARLWEGIVTPSDDAWRSGAVVLGEDPAADGEFNRDLPESSQAPRARVHRAELGETATLEARAEAFADILTACSECHALTR